MIQQPISPLNNILAMISAINSGSRPGGPGFTPNPLEQLAALAQANAAQQGQPGMGMPGISPMMLNKGLLSQGLPSLLAKLQPSQNMSDGSNPLAQMQGAVK